MGPYTIIIMKILRETLAQYAKKFLNVLNAEGIRTEDDVQRAIERSFDVAQGEQVWIGLRPSEEFTYAYTLSYIVNRVGIPIELKLNRELGYTKAIVKVQAQLSGYKPFLEDGFKNIVQQKILRRANVDKIRNELESLACQGRNCAEGCLPN